VGWMKKNLAMLEQLRQPRSLLTESHADLQKQYADTSNVCALLFSHVHVLMYLERQAVTKTLETQATGYASHDVCPTQFDVLCGAEARVDGVEADLRNGGGILRDKGHVRDHLLPVYEVDERV
jgi:hypothetical protein